MSEFLSWFSVRILIVCIAATSFSLFVSINSVLVGDQTQTVTRSTFVFKLLSGCCLVARECVVSIPFSSFDVRPFPHISRLRARCCCKIEWRGKWSHSVWSHALNNAHNFPYIHARLALHLRCQPFTSGSTHSLALALHMYCTFRHREICIHIRWSVYMWKNNTEFVLHRFRVALTRCPALSLSHFFGANN